MTRLTTIALTLCLLAGFSPLAAATDFNETGLVDIFTALAVNQDTHSISELLATTTAPLPSA